MDRGSWEGAELSVPSPLPSAGALCIQGNIDPALAGLAILYALDLTRYLKMGTQMASKSESDFNSVERVVEVGGGGGIRGRTEGAKMVEGFSALSPFSIPVVRVKHMRPATDEPTLSPFVATVPAARR